MKMLAKLFGSLALIAIMHAGVHAATFSSVTTGSYIDPVTWGNTPPRVPGTTDPGRNPGITADTVTINSGHVITVPTNDAPNAFPHVATDTINILSGGTLTSTVDLPDAYRFSTINLAGTLGANIAAGANLAGVINVTGNGTINHSDDPQTATFGSVTFNTAGGKLTIDGNITALSFAGTTIAGAVSVQQDATLTFLNQNNINFDGGLNVAANKTLLIDFAGLPVNLFANAPGTFGAGSVIQVDNAPGNPNNGLNVEQATLNGATVELLSGGRIRFNNDVGGANTTDLIVSESAEMRMQFAGSIGDFTFVPGAVLTLLNDEALDLSPSNLTIEVGALGSGLQEVTLIDYFANDLTGDFLDTTVLFDGAPLTEGTFGSLSLGEYAIDYGSRTSNSSVVLQVLTPEPTSSALWGMLGLAAIAFCIWRRRQRGQGTDTAN